ncbi:MAG: hypothetical protein BMS9Abin29_1946 [Gemmatimonadota bacterium]|nr:MAG: hypothetical protein BMS9Abin29_1946 [Gemmatimonadota bacterium]
MSVPLFAGLLLGPAVLSAQYVPDRGDAWEIRRPDQVGMDVVGVQKAVDYAVAHEARQPRDQEEGQKPILWT